MLTSATNLKAKVLALIHLDFSGDIRNNSEEE
jgi:hypothetical protein